MSKGVLIGCDRAMEIYLGWWWSHYKKWNRLPVAIANFGLSDQGLEKAKRIGQIVDINLEIGDAVISCSEVKDLQSTINQVRQCIRVWQKKPFALSQSPFNETVWVDLDCEVRADVRPLFEYCKGGFGAISDEPHYEKWCNKMGILNGRGYDTSVVAYKKDSQVLNSWVEATQNWKEEFWGDDRILSHVIASRGYAVNVIPEEWSSNFARRNPAAKIVHYPTANGKAEIVKQLIRGQLFHTC